MTEPRVVVLTYAQRRVLGELTRDGASNATIARRLGCSPDTVKVHMKGIFAALDATGRTEVAVMCLRRQVSIVTDYRHASRCRFGDGAP